MLMESSPSVSKHAYRQVCQLPFRLHQSCMDMYTPSATHALWTQWHREGNLSQGMWTLPLPMHMERNLLFWEGMHTNMFLPKGHWHLILGQIWPSGSDEVEYLYVLGLGCVWMNEVAYARWFIEPIKNTNFHILWDFLEESLYLIHWYTVTVLLWVFPFSPNTYCLFH